MKTKVFGALLLAAALGTATAAAAACNCGGQGMAMKCGAGMQQGPGASGMQGCSGKSGMKQQQGQMVKRLIAAVSKTGLSAKQAAAVTDAVNTFKTSQMQMKANRLQMMPIDAFGDDKFDEALFKEKKEQMFNAKIGARIELFKAVYAVLTPDQRKVFKREFTAPMVQMMIRQNMVKGYMMSGSAAGMGKGMGKGMNKSMGKCGMGKCGGM